MPHLPTSTEVIERDKALVTPAIYRYADLVFARDELMDKWWSAAHGTTFGGNPVACRAGLESLKIMEEENLLENAVQIGDHIQARFERVQAELPIIGQVRGKGLMVAVDLVNRGGSPITADQVKKIIKKLGASGVVMTKCGQSALRLAPALILTQEQADEAVDIMLNVLREDSPEM